MATPQALRTRPDCRNAEISDRRTKASSPNIEREPTLIEELPNDATVLVAAMPGELKPLTRSWAALATVEGVIGFQHPSATIFAFYGGMGASAATRAFARAHQVCHPVSLYSVGWAGSLSPQIAAGKVLRPDSVRDLATGETYTCAATEWATHGLLLTARRVAVREEKQRLANTYTGANAVDMEAATLARLAQANDIPFRAIKAVSDTVDEDLPDLNPFITPQGQFANARFLAHVAIRPRHWSALANFGKQAALAAANLCDSIAAELGIEKPR